MGLAGLLMGNFMLVFIALFVYLGAVQESVAARGRILTSGVPVRDAAITDYHTLSHGDTLREAGNLLLSTSQHDFPVMLGGQVIGLLSRQALLRGILVEGPEAYVAGVMQRDFLRVSPDADLAEMTTQLATAGGAALVMEDEKLVGLLTAENLSEFLLLKQAGLARAGVSRT
jgi:predicted transcriptional regulator